MYQGKKICDEASLNIGRWLFGPVHMREHTASWTALVFSVLARFNGSFIFQI